MIVNVSSVAVIAVSIDNVFCCFISCATILVLPTIVSVLIFVAIHVSVIVVSIAIIILTVLTITAVI